MLKQIVIASLTSVLLFSSISVYQPIYAKDETIEYTDTENEVLQLSDDERMLLLEKIESDGAIQSFCAEHSIISPLSMNKVKTMDGVRYSVVYYTDSVNTMASLVAVYDDDFSNLQMVQCIAEDDKMVVTDSTTQESQLMYYSPARIADCRTWVCTQYESGGGYTDQTCRDILGLIASAISGYYHLEWFGSVIIQAGVIVACYVPSYKYCVSGSWKPVCEM